MSVDNYNNKFVLSIIIVHYNTFELTKECIKSIFAYNDLKKINIEIILVVNGDKDRNADDLFRYFPKLYIHKNKENIGFSKAVNIGLKKAGGNYYLLLNSDTVFFENTIEPCLNKLLSLKNKYILTPKLLNSKEGPEQVSYVPLTSLLHEIVFTLRIHKFMGENWMIKNYHKFRSDEDRIIKNGYIVATCMFFHKDVLLSLQQNKLYDNLFLYGEELFWGYFWKENNILGYYNSGNKIIHKIGGSAETNELYKRVYHQMVGEHKFMLYVYGKIRTYCIYFLRFLRWNIVGRRDKKILIRLDILKKFMKGKI